VFHHQLYPFHVRQVQAVQPSLNYERRKALSEWLPQQDAPSATFLTQSLLIDGACLKRNGILNTRHEHTYAD
jgi:hypothetical protein